MSDISLLGNVPSVTRTADNRHVTTSLAVAEYFGREHKNVLAKIKSCKCSPDFRRLNFKPSSYVNEQGKEQPLVEMTKDGFFFLAFGFTGAKAAALKEAYIARFNEMEAELVAMREAYAARLKEMNKILLAENEALTEETQMLTVQEYLALTHCHAADKWDKMELGRWAARFARRNGEPPLKVRRMYWEKGGVLVEKIVNVVARKFWKEAEEFLLLGGKVFHRAAA